jgi:glycosyltransferase involved in cell wall biosynthesis
VRILYLADIRFPLERANGIQTFETCYALAERGHAVTLAVRHDTHVPARDPFAFYNRPRCPHLHIQFARRSASATRRIRYLVFALKRATSRTDWDVVLTRDLAVAATLVRLPRRARPMVVYESHGYAPEVSRALPRLLGHAAAPSPAKLSRLAAREQRTWRRADAYITITGALARELGDRFGPRAHLAVIPDGVRLPADRVFRPFTPARRPLAAYAGHLYPWKGVDVFVEALARLPQVDGLIVGGHPGEGDLARVQGRAVGLGIADRVTFSGLLPPAEVAGQLADAQVLVLPNTATGISERYTSPLKLFEYLAAGRPIVASDLPALREIVSHGDQAWLVSPGAPAALAEGIAHLVAHPDLAASMAHRAWQTAAEYTWDRRAERIERLMQSIG